MSSSGASGANTPLQTILLDSARAHLRQGELGPARVCLEHVIAAIELDDDQHRADAFLLKGELESRENNVAEAEAAYRVALEVQERTQNFLSAARTLIELGILLTRVERIDEATSTLRKSLQYSSSEAPGELRARGLEKLGRLQRLREELDDAAQSFAEALRIREALRDLPGQERNLTGLGNVHQRLGRLEAAVTFHRRALEIAEQCDKKRVVRNNNNLGATLLELGEYAEAEQRLQTARSLALESGDRTQLGPALNNLGILRFYRGNAPEAQSFLLEALEIWTTLGRSIERSNCLTNLANNALSAGRQLDAVRWSRLAIEAQESTGSSDCLVHPWVNLARSLIELSRYEESAEAVRKVQSIADQSHSLDIKVQALLLSATADISGGQAASSIQHAEQARQLSAGEGNKLLEAEALIRLGEANLLVEQPGAAQQALMRAESILKGLASAYPLAQCRLMLGKLFYRAEALEAARDRVRMALETFVSLENAGLEWECLACLAEVEHAMNMPDGPRRLEAALALAREHRRPDLEQRTAELTARLQTNRTDEQAIGIRTLLALSQICHEADSDHALLLRAATLLARNLHLELAIVARPGFPAMGVSQDARALEEIKSLLDRQPDPAGIPIHHPLLASTMTVPIHAAGSLLGSLIVSSSRIPNQLSASDRLVLDAAAGVLALGLQIADSTGPSTTRAPDAVAFEGMVGRSQTMRDVVRRVQKVGPSLATVLIQGESGTGKELVARAIHKLSDRCDAPFIAISCPSIPRELLESELFGHEKGAFTGAQASRVGRIEAAHGGTLFLDEIGDMETGIQVKLLRFLQEREFQRVGGSNTISVDVRLLAATSRNLEEEIRDGRFRGDLYYRLSVVPIRVPSLRERKDDIPMLVDHFIEVLCAEIAPIRFGPGVMEQLERYGWPGNIRELRNLVENLVTMFTGRVVRVSDLPREVREVSPLQRATSRTRAIEAPGELKAGETLEAHLMGIEGSLIRRALKNFRWNQSEAARALGMSEAKLRYKMKRFGIERPTAPGDDRRDAPGLPNQDSVSAT